MVWHKLFSFTVELWNCNKFLSAEYDLIKLKCNKKYLNILVWQPNWISTLVVKVYLYFCFYKKKGLWICLIFENVYKNRTKNS